MVLLRQITNMVDSMLTEFNLTSDQHKFCIAPTLSRNYFRFPQRTPPRRPEAVTETVISSHALFAASYMPRPQTTGGPGVGPKPDDS
jgi:hypothetical protein